VRRTRQRLILVSVFAALIVGATALVLTGLNTQLNAFYGPFELAVKAKAGERVRVGGLIEPGSIQRQPDGWLTFKIRDETASIPTRYKGNPPDLFGDGQGVLVEGVFQPGEVFTASTIFAKHDENYMPKEVADALKRSGRWNENGAHPPASGEAAGTTAGGAGKEGSYP
jgi:cytochrome c-type biogenesis protein CcmE